jgi:hypothetical protein
VEEMPLSCSAEIMSGLAQQQDTLRTLYLEPHQRGEYDYEGMTLHAHRRFSQTVRTRETLYAVLGSPWETSINVHWRRKLAVPANEGCASTPTARAIVIHITCHVIPGVQ